MPAILRMEDGQPLLTGEMVGPTPVALYAEYTPITSANGPPFFIVEVTALQPGQVGLSRALGWASTAWGTLSLIPSPLESTGTIRASDMGYVTRASDPDGVVPYPPVLIEAFSLDRQMAIEPGQTSAAWGWGAIQFSNADGRFDGIAASWNSDGRAVRILRGVKSWDDARGIWLDPPYNDLNEVFVGVATPWFLDADKLTVPLRDSTYWIEKPLQADQYAGSGSLNGTATLTGKPKPKARGGTAAFPIRDVTPILVDPVNLIYQYSDAPGTVVHLYEGGAEVFTFAANTTDLYTGTTLAGQYRTDNSRGLFQLGSLPVHVITADVTGEFPVAGTRTTIALIAYYLLVEDMALPPNNIEAASFTTANVLYPYVGGAYFHPDQNIDGVAAVSFLLSSFGAKLIPSRTGRLSCFVIRALSGLVYGVGLTGFSIAPTAGRASGIGGATGRSTFNPPSFAVTAGHATGVGVATGIAPVITARAGTASGVGAASGVLLVFKPIVGTAAGVGAASGHVPATLGSIGSATAMGQATGFIRAIKPIVGTASGVGTATGRPSSPFSSEFSSDFGP